MNDKAKRKAKNALNKVLDWAESLKKLIALLAVLHLATSWYDPTFFGLLSLNPVIGSEAFKYASVLSILLLAYLLVTNWKTWEESPKERAIHLRGNLIAVIVVVFCSIVLINKTVAYQVSHPLQHTGDSIGRRSLLEAEYVAFVSITVFLIARVAISLYPQAKSTPHKPDHQNKRQAKQKKSRVQNQKNN